MKPFLVLGIASALIAGSFVAGRIAGTRPGPAKETRATPAADMATGTGAASAAQESTIPDRKLDPAQLESLAALVVSGTAIEQAPLEETAEATAIRRAETNERLTRELGRITDEQRRFLVDLNDRAIEFQRRLAGEFLRGTITHQEYMRQVNEEMLKQLEELNALVSDDQYRILTGLEPGADPFDFMISGVGGAKGSHTEVEGAL